MRAESAQVLSDLGTASHVAIAIGLRASYAEPKQAKLSLRLVVVPQMPPHTSNARIRGLNNDKSSVIGAN